MSAWLFMMATLVLGVQGGLLQYDLTHGQQQGLIFFTGGAAVGLGVLGGRASVSYERLLWLAVAALYALGAAWAWRPDGVAATDDARVAAAG